MCQCKTIFRLKFHKTSWTCQLEYIKGCILRSYSIFFKWKFLHTWLSWQNETNGKYALLLLFSKNSDLDHKPTVLNKLQKTLRNSFVSTGHNVINDMEKRTREKALLLMRLKRISDSHPTEFPQKFNRNNIFILKGMQACN